MRQPINMLAVVAACALTGCTSPTPYYDSRYGEAVNQAKALQTLDPDASRSTDPVTGLDGPAAKEGVGRYRDSFKTPERTFDVITSGGR